MNRYKKYTSKNNMRDLIHDNALLLPAISRFDIAFGFGDNTIQQICQENGVDTDTFLCVCNLLSGYEYDASSISLNSLMDYLKKAHTSFLVVELPKIKHNLIDALNFNRADEVSMLLMKFYDDYVMEVRKHMEYENEVIFKYVERMLRNEIDEDFSISRYSIGHTDTVAKLNELKDIFLYHYQQKDNARLSSVLLSIIICGQDMLSHFDVESKIFIPAVEKLEAKLRSSIQNKLPEEDFTEEESDPLAILSDREKDIIKRIAQGKVNKQIADELHISIHTVATHRRNISNKLEIHTAAGLIIFAIIHHLVNPDEVKPI